jgi:hypothetical protein
VTCIYAIRRFEEAGKNWTLEEERAWFHTKGLRQLIYSTWVAIEYINCTLLVLLSDLWFDATVPRRLSEKEG